MKAISTIKNKDLADLLIYSFVFFAFFEPRIFMNSPAFKMVDLLYLGVKCMVVVCATLYYIKQSRISFYVVALLIIRIVIFFDTFVAAGKIDTGWFNKTITIVGFAICVDIFINKNSLLTVKIIYLMQMIPILINLVMCLARYKFVVKGQVYYFIGMRTQFTNSMIQVMLLAFIISYLDKRKIFSGITIFTILVCTIQLIRLWVGTGLVLEALTIFFVFYFCLKRQRMEAVGFFCMGILLNIGIVFLRIQNLFAFIIEGMLHKSMTLSGRTFIWDKAIAVISNHPIIGYGEIGNGGFVPVHWANRPAPAHNSILQMLYDNGIIILSLMMIFFLYAAYKLTLKSRNVVSIILAVGLFVISIEMITEVLQYQIYFYIVPILACNIDKFKAVESEGEIIVGNEGLE